MSDLLETEYAIGLIPISIWAALSNWLFFRLCLDNTTTRFKFITIFVLALPLTYIPSVIIWDLVYPAQGSESVGRIAYYFSAYIFTYYSYAILIGFALGGAVLKFVSGR